MRLKFAINPCDLKDDSDNLSLRPKILNREISFHVNGGIFARQLISSLSPPFSEWVSLKDWLKKKKKKDITGSKRPTEITDKETENFEPAAKRRFGTQKSQTQKQNLNRNGEGKEMGANLQTNGEEVENYVEGYLSPPLPIEIQEQYLSPDSPPLLPEKEMQQ